MSVSDILVALTSIDNVVRSQAEAVVENEKTNNFANFCLALLAELQDESKPAASRQMAGVVLKNSVALDVRNEAQREALEARWKLLGADLRKQVKDACLSTLGSSSQQVRGTAALIIANLARIELPHGEWPDLIQILVSGCESGQAIYMEAALTALGYVCEEAFHHDDVADVLEKQNEIVVRAICAGMSSAEDSVKLAAVSALANSLEFIGDHLKNAEIQNFIISTTCDMVGLPNARVREIAMRCLVKIADLYYDLLPRYIQRLFAVTSTAITNPSEEEPVVLQALLFWIALTENERSRLEEGEECSGFAASGCSTLVDLCLGCMVKQSPTQTEEDWNTSTAGSKLLQTLAETVRDPIVPFVMKFVYAHINSADWRHREAAMMAFGCIMTGPNADEFATTVAQGVSVYLDGLTDSHPLVADTAGWVTGVVCENFPNIFTMQEEQCRKLIAEKIGPMINGPSTMMSIRASSIIHNLSLAFEDEDEDTGMATNCLSPYFQHLVEALLARIDREPDEEFFGRERKLAIEALNALIDAAANDAAAHVTALIPSLTQRIHYFIQQYKADPKDDILIVEGLLCGSLSAVCKKMSRHIGPHVQSIMAVLEAVFGQQADTSLEEAVMLLGTLASACGPEFAGYAGVVIDLVLRCASKYDEEDLCDAAIGVIGDFAANIGQEGFAPLLDKVVGLIFVSLRSEDVDREQKLSYFGCAGDICLHMGSYFSQYVTTLMGIAQDAFNASCAMNFKDNDDDEYYVMCLWDSICNLCCLILQGQRDVQGSVAALAPNMLALADYVCRNSASVSSETFAAAISLIGDVANVAIDKPDAIQIVGPLVSAQNISQCIAQGNSMKGEAAKQANWANKQIRALMGAAGVR